VPWSHRFVVHTVYCDGHDQTDAYDAEGAREATQKYADSVMAALTTPERRGSLGTNTGRHQIASVSGVPLDPKHVRQVTMLVYDEDDRLIHHIDSGIFGCEDRSDEPAPV